MTPTRLSVALVIATAAASRLPGVVGGLAAWSLPHVGILALVMVSASAAGWLTDRRAAAVLADGMMAVPTTAVRTAAHASIVGVSVAAGQAAPWSPAIMDGWGPVATLAVVMVVHDIVESATHRAMHRIPALWAIHEVHHSGSVYLPTLASRVHPIEGVRGYVAAMVAGWLVGGDTSASVLVAPVMLLHGAALHMPVRLPIGPLDRVLVTPQYHAIHHSADPRHHDANHATLTTLPDLLMGTARFDFDAVLECGTGEAPAWEADEATLPAALRAWWGAMWHPARAWFGMKSPQIRAGGVRDVRG